MVFGNAKPRKLVTHLSSRNAHPVELLFPCQLSRSEVFVRVGWLLVYIRDFGPKHVNVGDLSSLHQSFSWSHRASDEAVLDSGYPMRLTGNRRVMRNHDYLLAQLLIYLGEVVDSYTGI